MEGYYSSDEDIAWGVKTTNEIKRDLLSDSNSKINRRETFSSFKCVLNESSDSKRLPRKEHLKENYSKMLSSTLEKCSINGNMSSTSEYSTTNETTNSRLDEKSSSECILQNEESLQSVSSNYFTAHNTLSNSPTNKFLECPGYDLTKKVSLIINTNCTQLVENTIIISSDEEQDSVDNNLEDIIEILDEDILKDERESETNVNSAQLYITEKSFSKNYDSLCESDVDTYSSQSQQNENLEMNFNETYSSQSQQNENLEMNFNDTLEEMEFFLKCQNAAVNDSQKNCENESQSTKSQTDHHVDSDCFSHESNYSHKSSEYESQSTKSQSDLHGDSDCFSHDKNCSKSEYEDSDYDFQNNYKKPMKILSKSNLSSGAKENIMPEFSLGVATKSDTKFKTPIGKAPKQSPLPKPVTNMYKDIVSPVGVYIRNSPLAPIKRNMWVKNIAQPEMKESKKNTATCNIPEVTYKPSKKVLVTKKETCNLPGSIKKLVPQNSQVIKHQERITKVSKPQSAVHNQLLSDDLTMNMTDDALNTTEDISVITLKPAFIK